MTADYFHRLGLPRRFSIDPAALELAYLQAARAAHPDGFAVEGESARKAGVTVSADVNAAYATLKDPLRRAEHLLELLGGPTPAEDKSLPPALLMEVMETRERADEIRQSGNPLDAVINDATANLNATLSQVEKVLDSPEPTTAQRVSVRKLLNAARTWNSLIRDCEAN